MGVDERNAVVMTAAYEERTWQNKTIDLWERYCDNNNLPFILISKGPYISEIKCPHGYGISYKIGSIKHVAENMADYDRIFFVDCDTIVNPNYDNIFNINKSKVAIPGERKIKQDVIAREKEAHWLLKYMKATESVFGELDSMFFCSTSTFICTPDACLRMVEFLEDNNLYPNKNNLSRLEDALTIEGKPVWFGDQWMWNMFLTFNDIGNTRNRNWPYSLYPENSEFITDLWLSNNRKEIENITNEQYERYYNG